jgi:hypothetical protein
LTAQSNPFNGVQRIFLPEIKNAVRLQVHLLKAFLAQSGNPQEEGRRQVLGTQESSGFTHKCSCVPGHHFGKKGKMLCTCPASKILLPNIFLNR